MDLQIVSGGKRLLFFYKRVCASDRAAADRAASDLHIVEHQMTGRSFDPSLILGTAGHCRFGCPRVIVCSPLSGGGVPFPTTFWLTCPWLNRLIGTVESEGGVGGFERWLENHGGNDIRGEWLRFDMDHRLARMALLPADKLDFLRRSRPKIWSRLSRDGIGGTRYDEGSPIHIKCIHLHAASWLAFGRHPGGEWLKARGLGHDCLGQGCRGQGCLGQSGQDSCQPTGRRK